MRTLVLILSLLILTGALGCDRGAPYEGASTAEARAPRVSGKDARALVERGALLLDVRTPAEFARDGVPGARNVPYDQIRARAAELEPKERPIVVYCQSGRRSAIAGRALRGLGFAEVHDLGPRSAW